MHDRLCCLPDETVTFNLFYSRCHELLTSIHVANASHNTTSQCDEYVFFLVSLLKAITVMHNSVDGCLRWRCDQDINHGNFKQALKQLHKTSDKSAVAIPTSNSRAAWEEGAKVETEDASGVWRWAKILARHDDGTFNVYLYDDHGGQEWDNVRPVHLRSRCQQKQPKGKARRPSSNIPRWDGDNGAAFMAAMAAHANTKMISKSVSTPRSKARRRPSLLKSKATAKTKDRQKIKFRFKHRKRKTRGHWEEDEYESTDSDLEAELSDLSDDEKNVRNTLDKTNMDQRRSKAKARLAKQKRKSKESHTKSAPRKNGKRNQDSSNSVKNIRKKQSKTKLQQVHRRQVKQQLQQRGQQVKQQQVQQQHVQQHEHQVQQLHNHQQQQIHQQQQVQQQLDVGQLSSNETNAQEQNVQLGVDDLDLGTKETTVTCKDKEISNAGHDKNSISENVTTMKQSQNRNMKRAPCKKKDKHANLRRSYSERTVLKKTEKIDQKKPKKIDQKKPKKIDQKKLKKIDQKKPKKIDQKKPNKIDQKLVVKIPKTAFADTSNSGVDDGKETKEQTASKSSSKKTLFRSVTMKRAPQHKTLAKASSAQNLYSSTMYVFMSHYEMRTSICKRSSKQF